MRHPAQEPVGFGEVAGRGRVDPGFGGERFQPLHGSRRAQARVPSAEEELMGLDEELYLADAAAAELAVVPFYGGSGRASWWERGCKDVLMSVFAVSI